MKDSLLDALTYPLKSPSLRRFLIRTYDLCPECGGNLDTGWECNKCGHDAMPELRSSDSSGAT
jgi:hypothetical protein